MDELDTALPSVPTNAPSAEEPLSEIRFSKIFDGPLGKIWNK